MSMHFALIRKAITLCSLSIMFFPVFSIQTANALPLMYTDSFKKVSGDFSETLSLQRFDPTLGVLDSIKVLMVMLVFTGFMAVPVFVKVLAGAQITLYRHVVNLTSKKDKIYISSSLIS